MKKAILDFFKFNRTYQGGIAVYMQYGNRLSLRKQLNVQSYSIDMELLLFEELRSLAEISTTEFNSIMALPVEKELSNVVMEEPVDPLEIPVTEILSQVPESLQEAEVKPPIQEIEPQPVEILPEVPIEELKAELKEQPKVKTPKKFIKPKRR